MKKDLWLRLKHYHFDDLVPSHLQDHVRALFGNTDASTQAFASKLARKLGWSRDFALRAIEEYRKFVFLGTTSEFPVTPPKVIDQVWHEHLLFSRGYREFCGSVLGRDFDHNPELVPTGDQTATFQAQYMATLARYHEEFHMIAPADIWGTPKFNQSDADKLATKSRLKVIDRRSSTAGDDLPLYMYFDGLGGSDESSYHEMAEFGGGGLFSGGGGESSWGNGNGSSHGGHGGHGSDSSSSDSTSSGDGGGDGGGSGCSSGCGGGGCGGD